QAHQAERRPQQEHAQRERASARPHTLWQGTRGGVSVLALVPARGGSKGLPRKNLRLLGGKPLVVHAIEAGRAARLVDRVICSTDDPEIAEVARAAGAEVLQRPAELAGAAVADWPVFEHALR